MSINADEFTEKLILYLRGTATSKLNEVRVLPLHNWSQHYHLFLKTSVSRAISQTLKEYGIITSYKRMRLMNKLIKVMFSFLKHKKKDVLKERVKKVLMDEGLV